MATADLTPAHVHDCDGDTFLGTVIDGNGRTTDLYHADHEHEGVTVIARYSSDGPDYVSGWVVDLPVLAVARSLSVARGLRTPRF